MTIETHILKIIEGKKSAPITRTILGIMSQCYRVGVALRHFAYDAFLPATKLPLPVISIGNIVAGGSGKTPLVHYLTEALGQSHTAILSRGYRRKKKGTLLVKESTTVQESGDEPYLLARKLPKAKVIVGANRAFSGCLAKELEAKVLILDDGMQHRRLHRDIEIGVMDAGDLFGKGHYLPLGFLRDSPKRLAKVDLIVLNGVEDEAHLAKITPLIRRYSQAPITVMRTVITNSTEVASKKVASFCAIGAPSRFTKVLKSLGCDIVLKEEKPDHTPFGVDELEQFANRAKDKGAEVVVCTEKDAVKLPQQLRLSLPLIPLKMALTPIKGEEYLETVIKKVQQ